MPLITSADVDYALADIGSPVTFGALSTFGIFRTQGVLEQDTNGDFVTVNRRVLTVRDGTLANIAEEDSIAIDGTIYRVRNVLDKEPLLIRISVA